MRGLHGGRILPARRIRSAAVSSGLVLQYGTAAERERMHSMPTRVCVLDWLDRAYVVFSRHILSKWR